MIHCDRDMLLCDLAETYHIYDLQELPLNKVALFSYGLSEESRIKRKMRGDKVVLDTMLRALIADNLRTLVYFQTEDARKGINKPESIVNKLLGKEEQSHEYMTFKTSEDFQKEYERVFEKGE